MTNTAAARVSASSQSSVDSSKAVLAELGSALSGLGYTPGEAHRLLKKSREVIQAQASYIEALRQGLRDNDCELIEEAEDGTGPWVLNKLAASLRELKPIAEAGVKWLALRNCARIRVLGSAGLSGASAPSPYAFLTLELWTQHEARSTEAAIEALEAFTAKARQASALEELTRLGQEQEAGR